MGSAPILVRTSPEALAVICAEWLPQKMMYVRTDGSVAFGDRRELRLVLPDGREIVLEGQAVQVTVDERGQHVGFRLPTLAPETLRVLEEASAGARPHPGASVPSPSGGLPPPIVTPEARALIARLERGLREVHVPAHVSGERRWTEILRPALEVLRTATRPEVAKELLLETLLRMPASSPAERVHLERELVARLPRSGLFDPARLLASELPSMMAATDGSGARRVEAAARLITLLCQPQGGKIDESSIELLRALASRGDSILGLFPPDLREWIRAAPFLGANAAQVEEPLRELDEVADPVEYHERVAALEGAAEMMLARGLWGALSALLTRLQAHRVAVVSPFGTRSAIAAGVVDRFCSGDRLTVLVRALASAPGRQERELVAGVLRSIGAPAMVDVLELVKRSGDRGVRHAALRILQASGSGARVAVLRALADPEEEWYVTRNLISLFGELGVPSDAAHLAPFAKHRNEHVRRDYLEAIARLEGAAAERTLLRFLDDPSRVVQARAVRLLGRVGCKSEPALRYLVDLLEDEEVPEEDRDLVLAAIEAIAHLGNVPLPKRGTAEEFVDRVLRRTRRIGIRGLLASAGALWRSDEIRAALCGTLGKIGTEKAEKTLRKIAYDTDDPVHKKAEAAIFEIAERTRYPGG